MKRFSDIFLLLALLLTSETAAFAQQPGVITLQVPGVTLSIDTATGGRVISFTLDGVEQLSGASVHPRFYGSSLWLSPENKWKGNGVLDGGSYTVITHGPTVLHIASKADSIRGFIMMKEFVLHPQDSSVSINYMIRNIAADTQHVAPWEVTRVPTGGLAFFPSGDSPLLAKSTMPVTEAGGLTWYGSDTTAPHYEKMFRRGAEGWTAYVRNGYVFIKTYPIIGKGPWPAGIGGTETPAGAKTHPGTAAVSPAPGEENVEVYVNPAKTYMEVENQGPYRTLMARTGFLQYNTRWFIRKVPAGIAVRTGNDALVNYVREVVHHQTHQ